MARLVPRAPKHRGIGTVGLRVDYITAPPPGPQIQPGPSSAAASAAICLCRFPLTDEAAAMQKAKASALW